MKTEKQSIVPKSFIVMMMVMLGIALLPIRYYGYYVLLNPTFHVRLDGELFSLRNTA